jgi:hypothetical protein
MSSASGSLDVRGDKCPIEYHLSLNAQKSGQQNVAIVFSVTYTVKDDAYRKLNDVDDATISLTFNIIASQTSGTIDAQMNVRVHSQKYGDITEAARGSGNVGTEGGSVDLTVTDTYPGFQIQREIRAEKGAAGDETYDYTVNGNTVSKDEFFSYGAVAVSNAPSN